MTRDLFDSNTFKVCGLLLSPFSNISPFSNFGKAFASLSQDRLQTVLGLQFLGKDSLFHAGKDLNLAFWPSEGFWLPTYIVRSPYLPALVVERHQGAFVPLQIISTYKSKQVMSIVRLNSFYCLFNGDNRFIRFFLFVGVVEDLAMKKYLRLGLWRSWTPET